MDRVVRGCPDDWLHLLFGLVDREVFGLLVQPFQVCIVLLLFPGPFAGEAAVADAAQGPGDTVLHGLVG